MSTISFVKPSFPNEKRVAILPCDLFEYAPFAYDKIQIESGFGEYLNISDEDYQRVGCTIVARSTCYNSEYVFNLKLVQPEDYDLLVNGTKLMGWVHPNGSGKYFYEKIAIEKGISFFDIDSIYPKVYYPDGKIVSIEGLPKHFFWENSYIAGEASVSLAIKLSSIIPDTLTNVCVLGSGSVSQGAFYELSRIGFRPRMFYRKTLSLFYDSIEKYSIIVNGIEVDADGTHILNREIIRSTNETVLIIDAAADAGGAIEGTVYNNIENPFRYVFDRKYFLVNNAPSIYYDKASKVISKIVTKHILKKKWF